MNIKKLIGLYIDTNEYKFEPVQEGQEQEVYNKLKNYCGLDQLRRVKNGKLDIIFTAYTYHYDKDSLGETLEEYLNS